MKMKILSLLLLLLCSCESEGELTRTDVGVAPLPTESRLLSTGYFAPTSGITVAGSAKVYLDGASRYLSLEDFSVSSGPDLKVYLSTTASPTVFVNLGALGNGDLHHYMIPDGVDLATYNHVLIHCQQYSHLFAIAQLIPVQ